MEQNKFIDTVLNELEQMKFDEFLKFYKPPTNLVVKYILMASVMYSNDSKGCAEFIYRVFEKSAKRLFNESETVN